MGIKPLTSAAICCAEVRISAGAAGCASAAARPARSRRRRGSRRGAARRRDAVRRTASQSAFQSAASISPADVSGVLDSTTRCPGSCGATGRSTRTPPPE